jgi:Zn-dependent hydrolases, including glyoxylases
MEIHTIPLGPLQTNCYLICTATTAVCIDPGGAPNPVIAILLSEKLALSHILLTHLHFDHTYGVRALAHITGAPVYASASDRPLTQTVHGRGGMWGLPEVEPFDFKPMPLGDYSLLDTTCRVLATPGHTPGGLSYYFPAEEAIFTGDSLFRRSIGRTDFPGGSTTQLKNAIQTQLFPLPGDTRVYSGHGEPTTIGEERLHNPMFDDFSL